MLIFACCVGPSGKFDTISGPAVESIMNDGDILIQENGSEGICAAYNRVIQRARDRSDCEGIVLFHDDTKLMGCARDEIIKALKIPDVGVIGVVGGSGLYDVTWNDARRRSGIVNDTRTRAGSPNGRLEFHETGQYVDVVDGLLLIISPAAFEKLGFESSKLPRFHGYDTDFCLAARALNLKVVVANIPYEHHDKAGYGDLQAFEEAANVLRSRWSRFIRPLTTGEAVKVELSRAVKTRHAGRLRHVVGLALKGKASEIPLRLSSQR